MDNNNPAEMTNEDLEKDMQQKNLETPTGNQEMLNKSTAAEGTLKTPEPDEASAVNASVPTTAAPGQDLDELVHSNAPADSQDGSMPDPESLDTWESNDDDANKISS